MLPHRLILLAVSVDNRRHYHVVRSHPSHWKIASEFTGKIMEQILTVQYTA